MLDVYSSRALCAGKPNALADLPDFKMTSQRRLQTPDAPICEISLNYGEKRSRPNTPDEIRQMRDFLRRHAFWTYMGLFYNEGPRVLPGFKPFYFRRSGG
jgi:hypothetical protein